MGLRRGLQHLDAPADETPPLTAEGLAAELGRAAQGLHEPRLLAAVARAQALLSHLLQDVDGRTDRRALEQDFTDEMRTVIALVLGEGWPAVAQWLEAYLLGLGRRPRPWGPPPRRRGRPAGSGRFRDREDFYHTVVTDLQQLRQQGLPETQAEVAALWHSREHRQADHHDALVTELKRYCQTYGLKWAELRAAARHSPGHTE
jgi:hypothetical protein